MIIKVILLLKLALTLAVHPFVQGFMDGGGSRGQALHFLYDVEPCESGSSGTIDLQWHPGTWKSVVARTGYGLRYDPYHEGYNAAVWSQIVDPGGTGGWPVCYWVN